jgi:hypothetical protein
MTTSIDISFFDDAIEWRTERLKRAEKAIEAHCKCVASDRNASWHRTMADMLESRERMARQGRELHDRINITVQHLSDMAGTIAYAYKKSLECETVQGWESAVLHEVDKGTAVLKNMVYAVCAYPRDVDESESREEAEEEAE